MNAETMSGDNNANKFNGTPKIKRKGKGIKKVLKMIGIAFIIIVILIAGILFYISSRPAVPKNYTEQVKTGGDIEKKYLQMGQYEVSYMENNVMQSYKKYEIWYPSEITNSDKK